MRFFLAALLTIFLLSACTDSTSKSGNDVTDARTDTVSGGDISDTDRTPETTGEINSGEEVSVLVGQEGIIQLVQGDSILLDFPAGSMELGCVPEIENTHNYDPYFLEPGGYQRGLYPVPEGLEWVEVESASAAHLKENGWEVQLNLSDGRESILKIEVLRDGAFSFHWSGPNDTPHPVFFRLNPVVSKDEGFYGLGEVFDQVEHRGKVRAMQFEISNLESGYNEAHVPIPLLIGTKGWGIFVESMHGGVFAPGVHADDRARITFGLGRYGHEGLRFHLFAEEHPLDITQHYYEITGYPGAIAPWALGPWIWRDEVADQEFSYGKGTEEIEETGEEDGS